MGFFDRRLNPGHKQAAGARVTQAGLQQSPRAPASVAWRARDRRRMASRTGPVGELSESFADCVEDHSKL